MKKRFNLPHIRKIYKLVSVSSRPNSRLSSLYMASPRFHPRMKSEKQEGSFIGREEREEGKGHCKDTLREGEEEILEVLVRIL
jgi:hypothetical protein